MKYKNIVFDMGNVLVRFSADHIVSQSIADPADRALVVKKAFGRDLWDKLDAGTITNEETKRIYKSRLPERLHGLADDSFDNWIYRLPEVEGMAELIRKLKQDGLRTFLLSNISPYFSQNRARVPVISLLDGVVCSGDLHITKPNEGIFRYLCDTYDVDPVESLFVDDLPENTEAAKRLGFDVYTFAFDTKELEKYIYR